MKAVVLLVALAACGGGQPAPLSNRTPQALPIAAPAGPAAAPDAAEPIGVAATLAKLEQFSDDMCGCQDRDCADRVVDEMTRWAQDLASAGEATPRVNVAENARAKAAADQVSRCMSAVYARRTGSAAAP